MTAVFYKELAGSTPGDPNNRPPIDKAAVVMIIWILIFLLLTVGLILA